MQDRNDAPSPPRAELDELRESDRILRALLDHAPVLISTKDLQGKVTMANRHFDILDGYDANTFVGSSVFELFPPQIAEQLWANDRKAALEKRAIHEEEQVYHRDKTLHTYMTVKFPLFDSGGEVYATCAVSTDITDAKAARIDSVTASSGESESLALAEQLRSCMAARLIPHQGNPPANHVTLSLRLAFIAPESEQGQEEIYRLADQALYRAKHKGRNTVSR